MKKTVFIIIVSSLLLFTAVSVFGTDLWNGFTTDMTAEQFITHAEAVLSPRNIDHGEFGDRYYIPEEVYPTHDGVGNPRNLSKISLDIDFQISTYTLRNSSITAWFNNGKLYQLEIMSGLLADRGILLYFSMEDFGNYNTRLSSAFGNVYYWQFTEVDFYASDNMVVFVDRIARRKWIEEQ